MHASHWKAAPLCSALTACGTCWARAVDHFLPDHIANSQRNRILGGIIIVFKYNLTTISSKYMVLHHIYKELNILLYIYFINLRDFWFVDFGQFLWNSVRGKWKLICDSRITNRYFEPWSAVWEEGNTILVLYIYCVPLIWSIHI
jgi:hypothetical protein